MKLAVVGATGVVGETILTVLRERRVVIDELAAFASRARPDGLEFGGRTVAIAAATPEALAAGRFDAVFFASSDDASAALAPAALGAGSVVIDNSATFRMDPEVPLIVPEVNAHAIAPHHALFPVPNCTAIVIVMALAPIARAAGLRTVRAATYQAVSGAGRAGLEALAAEEDAVLGGRGGSGGASPFVAPIFRNVVPQIGTFDEHGVSGEERKVAAETRKILELPELHVAVTTVRVPVRRAHSAALFVETARTTSIAALAEALAAAPGIVFHREGVVTPRDVEGEDLVHVARLRAEDDSGRRFQLWVVGDQLRKGAATNGVQVLELLAARGRFDAGRAKAARA